jgi:hypothetical protein
MFILHQEAVIMWIQSGNIHSDQGVTFTDLESIQKLAQINIKRQGHEVSITFSLPNPLQARYIEHTFDMLETSIKKQLTIELNPSTSTVKATTYNYLLIGNLVEKALDTVDVKDKSNAHVISDLLKTTAPASGFNMTTYVR